MTMHDDNDDPQNEELDEEDQPQEEDESEDEGEDEGEDEVVQTQAEPSPAQEPNPAPPAAVGVGRRVKKDGEPAGRRRKKKPGDMRAAPRPPQQQTVQQQQQQREREQKPREADLLWEWIIDKCNKEHRDPGYVTIRVARVDVGRENSLGYLEGQALFGDDYQSAGEALLQNITDQFHMNSEAAQRSSVLYNITFSVKGDRGFSHRGQVRLPPAREINQRRHHQWYPPQTSYGPHGPPQQGFGYVPPPPHQPPPQMPQQPPYRGGPTRSTTYGRPEEPRYSEPRYDEPRREERREPPPRVSPPYPYPPYPYPPPFYQQPQQQPQRPYDDTRALREELRDMRGFMRDMFMDRMQQPPFPSPSQQQQPQQPQQPQPDWAALQGYIQSMEKMFGVKLTVAPPAGFSGLGAPPQQQPSAQPKADPERLDYDQTLARKVRAKIESRVNDAIDELFSPRKEEDEDEIEEDKPLPEFETIETPVPFPGTEEPIRYARHRKTGEIHWFGTFLSNPAAAQKYGDRVMDIAGKFAEAARVAAVRGLGGPPQPQQMGNGTQPPQQPPQEYPPRVHPPQPSEDDDDGFKFQ